MGFFKDFKDDFSDAVDDIIPAGDSAEKDNKDDMINTLTENVDVDGELSKLDGLLEKASQKVVEEDKTMNDDMINTVDDSVLESNIQKGYSEVHTSYSAPTQSTQTTLPPSDENAVITGGMTINGDLDSTGSIEVQGRINGNVRCNGKLTVTGMIAGNSQASEVFADAARIDGEINANGTVKVGAGSVVVGNIFATSAVIAGAVKGDIDVQGPVVVDTSAVVMGNVKSRSVQINNGAIIEGFCSQAYSEVDVSTVFES